MAKTLRIYTSDGAQTIYPVSFVLGYLLQDDIHVYLEDNRYDDQLEFTWLNSSQIELTTAVPAGVNLVVRRIVRRSELINDYTDGAILRERNLDDSFKQALMLLEEVEDGFASLEEFQLQVNLNMLGNRIINLGNAEDSRDAVPLEQIQTIVNEKFSLIDGLLFIDYGRVSSDTTVFEDFGTTEDSVTIQIDYGSV
jgi:hypothetical protein